MSLKTLDATRKIVSDYQTRRKGEFEEMTLGQMIVWALRNHDYKQLETVFPSRDGTPYAFYKTKFYDRLENISDEDLLKAVKAYFNG